MPPAKRLTPQAIAIAALEAAKTAVSGVAIGPRDEGADQELWVALEAVEQAMPQSGGDDSCAPISISGMTAEMQQMDRSVRQCVSLLGKSLPLLASTGAAGRAVLKEARAVHEHYTLKEQWEVLCALKQASEDASAAVAQSENEFSQAEGTDAKRAARTAHQNAMQQQEGAEAEYRAAQAALTNAGLSVDACLDQGAFPRELATTCTDGGPLLPSEARESEREAAYTSELARADAHNGPTSAAAARTLAESEAAAAAEAAAAEAAEAAKATKKLLEGGFTSALNAVKEMGNLNRYALVSDEQDEQVITAIKTVGTAAKALIAPPHSHSEESLNVLAGEGSVEQLKAYHKKKGFTWATLGS